MGSNVLKPLSLWFMYGVVITVSTPSQAQETDSCPEERHISIPISNTSSLHCEVGNDRACNEIRLSKGNVDLQNLELYPYLSTITVYKRPYSGTTLDSLNFSFLLPISDIGSKGIAGVKAEFMEAPGYHGDNYYEKPICRFFNFSGSSIAKSAVAETKPEVPYSCIGISIFPGVFLLILTSVPTSHQLSYVITWERSAAPDYYENGDAMYVWPEGNQIAAVAVMNETRQIHVVFQPPSSGYKIQYFYVSLMNQDKEMDFKQIDYGETMVTFRDVASGLYKVIVSPRGGVCEWIPCTNLTSAEVWIENRVEDSPTLPAILGAVLGGAIVVVGIVCVMWMARRNGHLRKAPGSSTILVTSLAQRDLEKQATSYFCAFLSAVLNTKVAYTLPKMTLNRSAEVTVVTVTADHAEDTSSSLLLQGNEAQGFLHRNCKCHLILRFSYIHTQHSMRSVVEMSENDADLCDILPYIGQPRRSGVASLKKLVVKRAAHQPVVVTFVQESPQEAHPVFPKVPGMTSSCGLAATVTEEDVTSDDQVTVMLNVSSKKKLPSDSISLCNKLGRQAPNDLCHGIKEYALPQDINELHKDLKSRVCGKKACISQTEVSTSEYWSVARAVFQKAAENQPQAFNFSDEVVTIFGTATEDGDIRRQHHLTPTTISSNRISLSNIGQNHSPLKSSARSQTTDLDSFSNVTEAERDILEQAARFRKAYSTDSQKQDVFTRFFNSDSRTRDLEALSMYDSFSNITEADADLREQIARSGTPKMVDRINAEGRGQDDNFHSDVETKRNYDYRMNLTGFDNCDQTEWEIGVTENPALQRLTSFRSTGTSGYESNDTPRSDVTQLVWIYGDDDQGQKEIDGLEGLDLPGEKSAESELASGKNRSVRSKDLTVIPGRADSDKGDDCVSWNAEEYGRNSEIVIYPNEFVQSIKPPQLL